MGYGDEIIAAGEAQTLLDSTGYPSIILDQYDNPRWHEIWEGNPAILEPWTAPPAHFHRIVNGPNCRPYITALDEYAGWTFNKHFHAREHVARLYLTEDEQEHGRFMFDRFGPYVVIEPYSKHENLRWPLDHWNELVRGNPQLHFVQHCHVHTGSMLVDGATYTSALTFRQACGLLTRASLYVRGESGMCHAAAALGIPQVTIWGACMDWDVLGGYPRQYGVGIGDPCGSYRTCYHCVQTMRAITPERVSTALAYVLETHAKGGVPSDSEMR